MLIFLGHLKKLSLAAKKLKDHKQSRLMNGMSNSPYINGELLVINVPQKLAAEIRPYSHLPNLDSNFEFSQDFSSCGQISPPMKTFQSTKSILMINGGAGGGAGGFSSPEPQIQNGENFQNFHAAEFHSLGNGLGTFPPRPKVTVKPRPVATIVAKTKRGSREIPQDIIYHHKENGEAGPCNAYVSVQICSDGSSGRICSDGSNAAGSPDFLLTLSPRRLPDGLGMSPSRSNTLKRPPIPPKKPDQPAVFQLSKKVDPLGDSSSECSATPSFSDDFPPPPCPLACEDSINALKTMRSESNSAAPAPNSTAAAPNVKRMSHESNSSIDSNSSSDSSMLPFAQENVGTIKQRNVVLDTVQQDGDKIWLNKSVQLSNDRRRHVQDVFLGKKKKIQITIK